MRPPQPTKIDRMNGYLSYSRVHGDTRLNEAKMAEIAENESRCKYRSNERIWQEMSDSLFSCLLLRGLAEIC